jgi:hypothetical protein
VSRRWMAAWRRAVAIAACDCERTGVSRVSEITADWAAEFEYRNTPQDGHLIGASLILDGAPCEELP